MLWHGVAWALVALGLAMWSLACWGLHALLGWDGWRQGLDWDQLPRLELPAWMAEWLGLDWLVPLRDWLVSVGPVLQDGLEALPPLGDWAVPLLQVLWGLGALALLSLGGFASLVVHWARRSQARPQNPRP